MWQEFYEELERIKEKMGSVDPGTKEYNELLEECEKMSRVIREGQKADMDEQDHRFKRALDEAGQSLKEKEARNSMWKSVMDLGGKIGVVTISGATMLTGIILTYKVEEKTIIASKIYSFVTKMFNFHS